MNSADQKVWEDLDYKHDAIIEASAGTGKTFALEHIVKQLVETKVIEDIRNLLLVTFTEKAAGELKERIRKILVDARTDACANAVKHLDEATICTIHSFCQELLQEYPFESGMQMTSDVIASDRELIEKAAHTVIVGEEFRVQFGEAFSDEMKKWDGTKDVNGLKNAVAKRVAAIIQSGLEPKTWRDEYTVQCFGGYRQLLRDMVDDIKYDNGGKAVGEYILDHVHFTNSQGRQKEQFENIDDQLENLWRVGLDANDVKETGIRLLGAIGGIGVSFGLYSPDGQKIHGADGNDLKFEKQFPKYKKLKDLANAAAKIAEITLLDKVGELAHTEFLRLKKQSRTMTFDDMVLEVSRMVKDAVHDVGNAAKQAFLKSLRMRYRIVLVDEFQDTDNKQWDIFRLLFSCKVGKIGGVNPAQGCLIVVGDPKQAIYGFRGADIKTYLKAKQEIETQGQKFQLKKMFRSTKEMVKAFNTIFKADGWFTDMSANGLPILYTDEDGAVSFPEGEAPEELKNFDYGNDEPVELLESAPNTASVVDKSTCLPIFLENMALEMIKLHENEFWMKRPDPKDRMNWSSMCVLVRSHADGDAAQRVLRAKGIPCRKYKEAGLFASAESESVLALFDYLVMPRNTGNLAALLLTPFFNVPLSEIETRLENGDRNFDGLCERWRNYISKREWVKFFESAMNNTDLGRPHLGDADFIRHRAGIRQIFDQLLTQCGRARELSAFADALRSWRRDDSEAGEDGSVRYKESEGDAVQIMTMHAAKGLEFNAVFIAAGFTGLNPMIPKEERQDELMGTRRLFYVALTRAKYKLYLPWSRQARGIDFWEKEKKEANPPMGSFLGQGILALYPNACDKVKGVDELPENHAGAKAAKDQPKNGAGTDDCPDLPPQLGMKGWRFKWDSFSSLNHHGAKKVEEVDGTKPKEDENQNATDDQNQNEEQKKSLVPKGALSGTVFHEVMEALCKNSEAKGEVDFKIGEVDDFKNLIAETDEKKSPLLELVRRRLSANGVANKKRDEDDETAASVIARMAWNALRTELDFGGNNKFKLCEIPLKDRKAEVNFVLDESNLDGVREEGAGALNGSIDLLVRRDDGYYIVDWKTNALDDYEDATVATAMEEAGYHLQYKIYTLAAEKWLGENAVKGIAYLFVRGGESEDHPSGKFVHPMKEEERAKFAKAFRVRIDASDKEEADKEKEEL